MRRFAVISAVCLGVVLTQTASALPSFKEGYGFGAVGRKRVMLVRRLVPDVPLADLAIRVKVDGRGEAQRLQAILETMLVQNGPRLSVNDKQPAVEVRCTVTSYSQPREDFTTQNKATTVQFSGSVSATFQVVVAQTGLVVVAGNETAQLGGTYGAAADRRSYNESTESLGTLLTTIGSRSASLPMPTADELVQRLMTIEARDIASHLVLLSEQVDVMLAKGPSLDDANKRAQAGQWSDTLTMLEGTKALDRPEDEAYRLYNIGVANEALAYKAEDLKAAQKFLEEASNAYGKALEDNPKEKYFLEPQNRIQTAMVRYRKIEEQTDARQKRIDLALKQAKATQGATPTPGTGSQGAGSQSAAAQGGQTPVAGGRGVSGAGAGAGAGGAGGGEVLTNDAVLKMVRAKFPERMVVAKIQSSARVQFDTSVDGMIRLKQAGATDAEIQVMDQRMQAKPGAR